MIRRFLALILLCCAILTAPALGREKAQRALILYDGTILRAPEGLEDAKMVANLLGHFDYHAVLKPVESYSPGDMEHYTAVFIVGGSNKTEWPADVLRDARARSSLLVWLGYGLDAFLDRTESRKLRLKVTGVEVQGPFRQVRYHDAIVSKGVGMLTHIALDPKSRTQVMATALNPQGEEAPYILHAGNLWMVADVPFSYVDPHDRYLVFCDVLHDMLGIQHETSRRAMIRLEDVTPFDDPADVRRAVNVFVREGIPFQVGIVPVYVDPGANLRIRLSERPEMVAALHDAVARGATLVLHGYTHQYHGVTPDDFEFWDGFRSAPRPDDSRHLVREKLTAALDECFKNDLYPVAWETPHYAASQIDNAEFVRFFSTVNEQVMIDTRGAQQFFPYIVTDTRGGLVVPENLGYLPMDHPDPQELIGNARAMLVVRDGIASAFVHDFIDPRLIQQVVEGIKGLGYQFVSLRDFPARVSYGGRLIATPGVGTSVDLRDQYLHEFLIGADGSHEQERWSEHRLTGKLQTTLHPQPGQILVAEAAEEHPTKSDGLFSRLWHRANNGWQQLRSRDPRSLVLPRAVRAAVLTIENPGKQADANDQASFENLFRAYGVTPRMIPAKDFSVSALQNDEILVIPHVVAVTLAPEQVDAIVAFVRAGGQVLIDGHSPLSEALEVRYPGGDLMVANVKDHAQLDMPLAWRPAENMERFRTPDEEGGFTHDLETDPTVASEFALDKGNVVYLGTLFDPFTRFGTSRYPFLFEDLLENLERAMLARRRTIELYFDPGLRPEISIEDLAVLWRRMGVRAIYAAAWAFDEKYTYDYERLLRVCHANGILVYAWFELPQVSPLFWKQHPEWREVAAAGEKYPSWRLAMNLTNPACRNAAVQNVLDIVNRWPWDGVNLAELNFDGTSNGDMPQTVVPMNADVRQAFRARYGFDPKDLFDRGSPHWWRQDKSGWKDYLTYRTELVSGYYRTFLTTLRPFAASGHEIIVTVLDSLAHPSVTADTGVDSREIINMLREHTFTLQVEDPASAWVDPPDRYTHMAELYKPLLPAGARYMFDVNIVPNRVVDKTHLPMALAGGVELASCVRAASTASDRVALYGDATVRTADLDLLSFAASGRSSIQSNKLTWSVETPNEIELAVPAEVKRFYVSGSDWSFWRTGYVLLPPGRHELRAARAWAELFDTSALHPRIMQISSPLLSAGLGTADSASSTIPQAPYWPA